MIYVCICLEISSARDSKTGLERGLSDCCTGRVIWLGMVWNGLVFVLVYVIVKIFAWDFLICQSSTIFQLPLFPRSSIQPRCLPHGSALRSLRYSRAPTRHCGSYCNQQEPICAFSGSLTSFGLSAWPMLKSARSDRGGLFVVLIQN